MKTKPPAAFDSPEDVVAVLGSEYGDVLSATRPYKRIMSVSLFSSDFDAANGGVTAVIRIRTDHQGPQGNTAEYDNDFRLTQEGLLQVARDAPDGHRRDIVKIAHRLEQQEQNRLAAIRQAAQDMTRLKTPVVARRPGTFRKIRGLS